VTRARLSRIFWIGAATILVVAALIGLVAILRGRFTDTDARIILTLVGSLLAGGTLLAGLALHERSLAPRASRLVLVAAPACFVLILYGIWAFRDEDGGHATQVAWSGVLVLVATLLAATARSLASAMPSVGLARACAALATAAALTTLFAVWRHHPGSALAKLIAALWILTALAFFLVPIVRRWTAAAEAAGDSRVLASLGDVELVATRTPEDGVVVEYPQLARGERLVLRARSR
jgi:hypothetical protein